MVRYLVVLAQTLLFVGFASAADCEPAVRKAADIAAMRDSDPAAGLDQGLEELLRFEGRPTECLLAQALLHRAVAINLHILGRYDEALQRTETARALVAKSDNAPPEQVAKVHLTSGVVLWTLEAHDEAIVQYHKALEASEAAGDPVGVGRAAGNIGNLYSTMGDYERARDHHQRALLAFEQADALTGMAGTLVNLAALSGRLAQRAEEGGDPNRARENHASMYDYSIAALDRFRTLDNPRGIAYAAANAAEALEGLGRPEDALDYHQQALELQRQVGDRGGQVQSLIAMARTHLAMEGYAQAADLLADAQALLPADNLAVAVEIRELQVAVAEGLGDYRAALAHQKTLTRLGAEIAANQMVARVEEVRLAMEAEQRERQIALLQSEAKVADLRIKRQQSMFVVAVLVALLLLGLLTALYMRYRLRVKTSRQLDIASRTDPLTGLSNRRDMMERLGQASAVAREGKVEHGLIVADIDDFKHINDEYGHSLGDEVLVQIASLMANAVKGKDVVCRWGGEEFLILLPQTGMEGATAVAENVRRAITDRPIETTGRSFEVTISLGVATLNADTAVDEAIGRADRAMYRAKQSGKNRFELDQ